ncbi:MAG: hypothetical protein ACKVQU_33840 [Burkholderiales bacterium]
MDWICLLGWCAMAADAAKDVASAVEEAALAGATAAREDAQQDEQAGQSPLSPGEIAKWVGLAVFILAQVLAPFMLRLYHRRVVKAMGSSARDTIVRDKSAHRPLDSVDALVTGVRSRYRIVLAILCVSVSIFALIAGLSYAFRGETLEMEILSTLTSIALFAALGGPIVLLGVSATKFGQRFWTWFAPFAFAAIAMQLKVSEIYRELGEIKDDAKAATAADNALAYCTYFFGGIVAVTIAAVLIHRAVGPAGWLRLGRWVRAHPRWSGLAFAAGFVVLAALVEEGGFIEYIGLDIAKSTLVAAICVGLCYYSLGNRSQRVVVPLLAVGGFAIAASIGFFGKNLAALLVYLGWFLDEGANVLIGAMIVNLLIAIALAIVVAWFVLGWIGIAYERKGFSDAQFEVYAWMLSIAGIVVFLESTLLGGELFSPFSKGVAIGAVVALVAYSMLIRLTKPLNTNKRLLLLRVFAQDSRSERLLDELAHRWRFAGPIMMIGGPDLARSTLDPAEVAHFLRMQFDEDFISDRGALDRKIMAMDERPDPDGRYRVNEFFCYDDIWQETVERLVTRSDAILLDLRGFTLERRGTAFEIGLLTRMHATARTVFLLDDTTDLNAVTESIGASAWAALPENHRVQTAMEVNGEELFRALAECAVVEASPPAKGADAAGIATAALTAKAGATGMS